MDHPKQPFEIRPAHREDAEEITGLVIACDIAEYGRPDFVLEDLLDIWNAVDLENNTWIVRAEGRSIGYAFLEHNGEGMLSSYGYVHPDYIGMGVGTKLVERIESRALEYVEIDLDQDWVMSNVIPARNESARSILEHRGYGFRRLYSRMIIDLEQEPSVQPLPGHLSVRAVGTGMDAAMLEAYRESFQDTNRFFDMSLEEWTESKSAEQDDRSLWFTAWDGNELAGFIVGKNFKDHVLVELLGVRPAWRKQGVGLAMLQSVFREAWKKGIRNIQLSVDAASLGGATRLYERAGMTAVFQMALYEKLITLSDA